LTPAASSVLLTLADSRFPAGGYAHSGGLEDAVATGRVREITDLKPFLVGRLCTIGYVEATLSAMSCMVAPSFTGMTAVHEEALARSPSPAMRRASKAQGRALLRAASRTWPGADLLSLLEVADRSGGGVMHPVALGAVGAGVGVSVEEVALLAAQASVSGPGWAATRLLGVDPFAVSQCLAQLAPLIEEVATKAGGQAKDAAPGQGAVRLPGYSAPLIEMGAERHFCTGDRLFAS
jgi:urease accessory protein